jgi:plastocyanin
MRLRGFLVLAVSAAFVLAPAAVSAVAGQLNGTVGPGYSIILENANGATVTKIDPGTYEIVVRDESIEHNFHLFGPGVNETTQVEETGTVTWTVTFGDGRYTLQCDPHSIDMHRTFISGNPPPDPEPVPQPKPPPARPKLLATVGPKDTISLRNAAGGALKAVKAGTYAITVRDRSKLHNFHLVGKGVNRKTGKAAIGTFTWKVSLGKGALRFFSDQSPRKVKGSVAVS